MATLMKSMSKHCMTMIQDIAEISHLRKEKKFYLLKNVSLFHDAATISTDICMCL